MTNYWHYMTSICFRLCVVCINESFTQGESPSVENVPVSSICNHLLLLKLAHLIMFSEKNPTLFWLMSHFCYWPPPTIYMPNDIDPCLCTHLLYAFATIKNNQLATYVWMEWCGALQSVQCPEEQVSHWKMFVSLI